MDRNTEALQHTVRAVDETGGKLSSVAAHLGVSAQEASMELAWAEMAGMVQVDGVGWSVTERGNMLLGRGRVAA